jgi:hypothetical protein
MIEASEFALHIRVPSGFLRVRAQEVADDDVAHLFVASCGTYVNVVAARALRWLSEEVVIGGIRIGCEQISEAFEWKNERVPLANIAH